MDNELVLNLLNANFKTFSVEKYPETTMKILIEQAADKILGKDFKKNKIGVKKQFRIHDIVLNQMKIRYGSLVNVKILNVKKWTWATNLNRVYKTDMGRLFGTYVYDDLFYTSHSIDRWNERVDHDKLKYLSQFFKIRYHTSPTDLDMLMFNVQMTRQIGLKRAYPNYRYLSMNQGCLILEVLQGICIAKTFLSCAMTKEDTSISWFGYDKKLLTNISDCIVPLEDLKEEYIPIDEEIPVSFCAAYFKVL